MALDPAAVKKVIEEIRGALRQGRLPNEAAVYSSVVLKVLHALGWPIFDPQVAWPEYAIEGRRVDLALCHPAEKPLVLVEVKQVGQGSGADKQLFEYAFHRGVQFAVLTDGQEWHFYLPAERGDYQERRVYRLDLMERDPEHAADRFMRYLGYENVCSGKFLQLARADYEDVARAREIEGALPAAWRRLVQEQDSLLIDLIADKVADLCGYKPEPDAVARFVTRHLSLSAPLAYATPAAVGPAPSLPHQAASRSPDGRQRGGKGAIGFSLRGQHFPARNAREVLTSARATLRNGHAFLGAVRRSTQARQKPTVLGPRKRGSVSRAPGFGPVFAPTEVGVVGRNELQPGVH